MLTPKAFSTRKAISGDSRRIRACRDPHTIDRTFRYYSLVDETRGAAFSIISLSFNHHSSIGAERAGRPAAAYYRRRFRCDQMGRFGAFRCYLAMLIFCRKGVGIYIASH
jgi:hypothetical protein